MISILTATLFKILSKIAMSALAEPVLEKLVWWLLEQLAKNTKTNFDDEMVVEIKASYQKRS